MGATRVIALSEEALGNNNFYDPIPVGTKLRMTVFDIEETVTGPNSKIPGKPQAVFTAKITEDFPFSHVDADSGEVREQNALGREIRYNYIPLFAEAGNAFTLVAFAEAVGWPVTKGASGKPEVAVPVNLKEVLGTEFIGKIGQQTGQSDGKVYNNIRGFQKPGKASGTKPAAAEKKSWKGL